MKLFLCSKKCCRCKYTEKATHKASKTSTPNPRKNKHHNKHRPQWITFLLASRASPITYHHAPNKQTHHGQTHKTEIDDTQVSAGVWANHGKNDQAEECKKVESEEDTAVSDEEIVNFRDAVCVVEVLDAYHYSGDADREGAAKVETLTIYLGSWSLLFLMFSEGIHG